MLNKNLLPDFDRTGEVNQDIIPHIPIACHYSNETLLSKNRELIQIIEITGYENESKNFASYDIRSAIRKAIVGNINDYNYSIYIHTVRNRKNLMPEAIEPFGLADKLNKEWSKLNNWHKQFVNTIYISVIIKPNENSEKQLKSGFSLKKLAKKLDDTLEKNNKLLTQTTDKIIDDLKDFGVKKLSIIKTTSGYISEQLGFYYELIHLNQRRTPVPIRDVSEFLSAAKINFHFNTAEVISSDDI